MGNAHQRTQNAGSTKLKSSASMPPMNKNPNRLPVSITLDVLNKSETRNMKQEEANEHSAQTESLKKRKTLKQSLSFDSRANKEHSKHEIGLIGKMKKQLSKLSNQSNRNSVISENDEERNQKSVSRSITDHNLLAIADEETGSAVNHAKRPKLDRTDELDDDMNDGQDHVNGEETSSRFGQKKNGFAKISKSPAIFNFGEKLNSNNLRISELIQETESICSYEEEMAENKQEVNDDHFNIHENDHDIEESSYKPEEPLEMAFKKQLSLPTSSSTSLSSLSLISLSSESSSSLVFVEKQQVDENNNKLVTDESHTNEKSKQVLSLNEIVDLPQCEINESNQMKSSDVSSRKKDENSKPAKKNPLQSFFPKLKSKLRRSKLLNNPSESAAANDRNSRDIEEKNAMKIDLPRESELKSFRERFEIKRTNEEEREVAETSALNKSNTQQRSLSYGLIFIDDGVSIARSSSELSLSDKFAECKEKQEKKKQEEDDDDVIVQVKKDMKNLPSSTSFPVQFLNEVNKKLLFYAKQNSDKSEQQPHDKSKKAQRKRKSKLRNELSVGSNRNDNDYIYTNQTASEKQPNPLDNISTRNGNDNVFVYLKECRNSYEYNFTYEEKLHENFSVYASLSFLNKTAAPLASSEVTLLSASDDTVSTHDTKDDIDSNNSTQSKKNEQATRKLSKNASLNGKKQKSSNGSGNKKAKGRQEKV